MKKLSLILLVCIAAVSLCACNWKLNKPNTDTADHTLVAIQKFEDSPTGAVEAKITVTFVKGTVFSIFHEDFYDTADNAKAMYDKLMENEDSIKDQIKVELHDDVISYYEKDVSQWSTTSFDEMVKMFDEDESWEIENKK